MHAHIHTYVHTYANGSMESVTTNSNNYRQVILTM